MLRCWCVFLRAVLGWVLLDTMMVPGAFVWTTGAVSEMPQGGSGSGGSCSKWLRHCTMSLRGAGSHRNLLSSLDASSQKSVEHEESPAAPDWIKSSNPHVVLIGSPGVGKTTLGAEMGKRLQVPFVDADHVRGGVGTGDDYDAALLERWLGTREVKIVACGGYAITLPAVVCVLEKAKSQGHIVVHIQREGGKSDGCDGDIKNALAGEMWSMEQEGGALDKVYSRARTHQFYVPPEQAGCTAGGQGGPWGADELFAMLARLMETECPRTGLLRGGCVVSIAAPTVMGLDIGRIQQGAEAVELRVDLLHGSPKQEYAMLRQSCLSRPLLWTVRSKSQGGAFCGTEREYAALVQLGAELGAEFIDVECVWPAEVQDRCIAGRRTAKVVSTYVDSDARWYSSGEIAMTLKLMATSFDGHNHCVHFSITPPLGEEKSQAAEMAQALAHHSSICDMPAIGTCSSALTFVPNTFLTWTSHQLLPPALALLTASQAMQENFRKGLASPGSWLDASPSPGTSLVSLAVNAAAAQACATGAPGSNMCTPASCALLSTEALLDALKMPGVRGLLLLGASSSLKQQASKLAQFLSADALSVGAVTSLQVVEEIHGKVLIRGDNSEVAAFHRVLSDLARGAKGRRKRHQGMSILVLGCNAAALSALHASKRLCQGFVTAAPKHVCGCGKCPQGDQGETQTIWGEEWDIVVVGSSQGCTDMPDHFLNGVKVAVLDAASGECHAAGLEVLEGVEIVPWEKILVEAVMEHAVTWGFGDGCRGAVARAVVEGNFVVRAGGRAPVDIPVVDRSGGGTSQQNFEEDQRAWQGLIGTGGFAQSDADHTGNCN